eukprot:m.70377 g.70377  ORF g.70377 m.70377 type:complete len:483 (+) comp7876_c0_seq1:1570-3018(+)
MLVLVIVTRPLGYTRHDCHDSINSMATYKAAIDSDSRFSGSVGTIHAKILASDATIKTIQLRRDGSRVSSKLPSGWGETCMYSRGAIIAFVRRAQTPQPLLEMQGVVLLLAAVAQLSSTAFGAAVRGGSMLVTVKYPQDQLPNGATLALRGSACGLNWSEGRALDHVAHDTWNTTISCGADPAVELKVLIDDKQWQRGANLVLDKAVASAVLYPWFYSTAGKYVTIAKNVYSQSFDNYRDIVCYLPPSYDENPCKTYPTLIMHDGNNLFNASTAFGHVAWQCQDTLDHLIGAEVMDEIVVVGVDNTAARMEEYTYSKDAEYGGGRGDEYLDFLENTVIPLAQAKLRVRTDRANLGILGSSLGGLISCYAGCTRPQVYSRIGCMSSSFWWNNQDFNSTIIPKCAAKNGESFFYLDSGNSGSPTDCGSEDADDCVETQTIVRDLVARGLTFGSSVFYYLDPGAQHSEYYWGHRFNQPMLALYGV